MKSLLGILYLLALLMAAHLLTFNTSNNYTAAEALQRAEQRFRTQLDELGTAIGHYEAVAGAFARQEATVAQLQEAHLATRLAYKRVENLLEYNDRKAVKKHLNGPPLLSLEPKVPEVNIIEPVGLQVLDELVFLSLEEDTEEVVKLTQKLRRDFSFIRTYQQGIPLQHRHIFESSRYELVRIFTLGLTGFDTPGSVNALPEAVAALRGVAETVGNYWPIIEQKDAALAKNLKKDFEAAIDYLQQHNDFDRFDRLHFLKAYTNPLFANLLQAQKLLGIETIDQATDIPQAFNYQAENLFAPDFLNASYYARLGDQQYMEQRVELGRLLFFDPILSSTNEKSCASCHDPQKGFTDGQDKSLALNGKGKIQRNAPTVINAVFAEHYFYDLREPELERQVKHVVLDPKEFDTDFFVITDKLAQSKAYQKLFSEAYPNHPNYQLSKWSVSNALACYVASLNAFDSPVDQFILGKTPTIAPAVARGFNLFMGKASCGTCHFAPTFGGIVPPYYQESESEVLGVPSTTDTVNMQIDADPGRVNSGKPEDHAPFYIGSFKTVTVRNVALTAPYMHNGVYQTLEEVVDFYNKGGGAGMGMDVPYQTLPDAHLNLTEQEVSDLVIFMEALTDTTGLTATPRQLPQFEDRPAWNSRGGKY